MNNKQQINSEHLKILFYIIALLGLLILFIIYTKSVLLPLVFATFLAIILSPLCNYLESKKLSRLWSILVAIISLGVTISIILSGISFMLFDIYSDLPLLKADLSNGVNIILQKASAYLNIPVNKLSSLIEGESSSLVNPIFTFLEQTLSNSIVTISNVFFILIFSFLILLYRKDVKYLILYNQEKERKEWLKDIIEKCERAIKSYANGILFVSFLIGTINSITLWLIGIKQAFFWGYLGGILIVIPYIGTIIGGLLPFLYALATTSTYWQPIAIVIFYILVQQIEGNFITPKIMGDRINVNPFAVIVATICGGLMWGIPGIILAIPGVGIIKILLLSYVPTTKLGYFLSGDLSNIKEVLKDKPL